MGSYIFGIWGGENINILASNGVHAATVYTVGSWQFNSSTSVDLVQPEMHIS